MGRDGGNYLVLGRDGEITEYFGLRWGKLPIIGKVWGIYLVLGRDGRNYLGLGSDGEIT